MSYKIVMSQRWWRNHNICGAWTGQKILKNIEKEVDSFFILKIFLQQVALSDVFLLMVMVIPDICQFWYTTELFRPVKSIPKST